MARGIEALTADEALRRRLGEQAHRTAYQRFLLSTMIDATDSYYMDVVRVAGEGAGKIA